MGRSLLTLSLALAVTLLSAACIVIDDNHHKDDPELITVDNLTSERDIDFFIDGRYEATLNAFGSFTIEGDFEGTRELFAENDFYEWGPDRVRIDDGDHITWTLDVTRARRKVAPAATAPSVTP